MRTIRSELALFAAVRTISNTAYRMVYPYLPVFARALGIDLGTMSLALSARAASGALGPLLAPLTDRRGRAFGLSLGLGLFTAGAFLAFAGPGFMLFALALVSMTIGKYVLDPAVLAHLSDVVPYRTRGRALALTELSWSLAFVLGVPAAGLLVAKLGWRSPFAALGLLGLAGFVTVRAAFGHGRGPGGMEEAGGPASDPGRGYRESYRAVVRSPAALSGIAVIMAVSMSNELVNLVFGVWLEDSFGLKLAALGATAAVIGVAEFGGESLVVGTVDRLGKIRALMIGLAGNTLAALVLPLAGRTTATALFGLALFYLTFEYTVVSMLPVMSEILPRARATLLAFYAASFSLGRAIGSLISPHLYGLGFAAVTLVAAGLDALAFLLLLRLRRLTAARD
ncbi:MAG: MFS transporter [Candidatus Aminicenantes bacterium]|nr:MFS transporter [Candidatus Aminicenantes bacterium]